eukprot:scaffold75484_cov44-Cyclotella_meneghiniana.AAC.2
MMMGVVGGRWDRREYVNILSILERQTDRMRDDKPDADVVHRLIQTVAAAANLGDYSHNTN